MKLNKECNMKYLHYLFIASVCFVSGCAHRINITPDTAMMNSIQNSDKIQGTAGYCITPEMRQKEVITPAGGGDRVRYTPYKDIEEGFKDVLENVFLEVRSLDSNVAPNINNNSVDYVVSLEIDTDSSSASMLTWPPTWFGVSLETELFNTETKETTKVSVKGEGSATYSKFIMNKGITGQEATLDALEKLQMALLSSNELKTWSNTSIVKEKTPVAVAEP